MENSPATRDLEGAKAWGHVMYALHALSAISGVLSSATVVGAFVFGWPSIIAVILNYVKRDEVAGTWLETHYRWQLRTFWFALLWLVIAGVLTISLIGIPAAILVIALTGIWVLYRVVRGWTALAGRQSMPVPPQN